MNTAVETRNGVVLPRIGLGIFWMLSGEVTRRAVQAALESGYRHVDSAAIYENEQDAGDAIRRIGFELDRASMARLDGLEVGLTTGWDPRGQP